MKAIVTVKLPKNPKHNPKNKKTGKCPLFHPPYRYPLYKSLEGLNICTDITGSYHSYIETGKNGKEIREKAEKRFGHIIIIRIEIQ